jgi:hypothetical protein
MNLDTDFPAIYQKGLLKVYEYDWNNIISIVPTTLGIILYMVAQNKFDDMWKFCEENIWDFENIELPKKYDLEELQFVNISGLYSYNNVQR